jgi:two-component system OmpR family response regulator
MTTVQGSPKRILIIDDEQQFCSLTAMFLQERGYEVATASSGTEALVQLERFHPDVVLLDVVMPGLSGLEILKLMRERAFPPRVIMITATDDLQVAQQALQEGAEAYMCKPVSFDELERAISRIYPAKQ